MVDWLKLQPQEWRNVFERLRSLKKGKSAEKQKMPVKKNPAKEKAPRTRSVKTNPVRRRRIPRMAQPRGLRRKRKWQMKKTQRQKEGAPRRLEAQTKRKNEPRTQSLRRSHIFPHRLPGDIDRSLPIRCGWGALGLSCV